MFPSKRITQKPDEELYAAFKETLPEVGPGSSSALQGNDGPVGRSSTLSEAFVDETAPPQRAFESQSDAKKQDAHPKPFTDAWRFTPSLMDPNSFAFSAFAYQPPGYYNQILGGFGTLYRSQASDLETPGMGMNTPLSLPHSIHALHAQDPLMHLQQFNPHLLHQQHSFQDPSRRQQAQVHVPMQKQQSLAPQQVLQYQDSGYMAMDDPPHMATPMQAELGVGQQNMNQTIQQSISESIGATSLPMGQKFRFHTTLNAPTAMVRHADEIPITYLDKGHAYTISIWDTTPPMPRNTPLKYRTYVRVSFEDGQQRAQPGGCWQLWKEGRGSNEAHQRGGRLVAVEYVDLNQGDDDELWKSQIQLENASFDGFAVTWFPNPVSGGPDCSISIRFNFLSTDFSRSKGVKGIPVRLCAKTELVTIQTTASNEPEVCFCKVKLFRGHGAERKFSNDVAHVKKLIDELRQQIYQAEADLGSAGSMAKAAASRPGEVMEHKRTRSVDSDVEEAKFPAEEDLQIKLVSMQDMFSSTRLVSVLFLRGHPDDDPDLHPVKLPEDDLEGKEILRTTIWESRQSGSDSPTSKALSSLSSSSASQDAPKRKFLEFQPSAILEEGESEYDNEPTGGRPGSSCRPVKILKTEAESVVKPDLFAVDVDSCYQPPVERSIRPVACLYVRQKDAAKEYYRAIYLMQRTVKDLINNISTKFQIDPYRVTQVTHINSRGLHNIVDEDVIRELPEGQEMIVEFTLLETDQPVKHEFISPAAAEVVVDSELPPADSFVSDPLEMWLNY